MEEKAVYIGKTEEGSFVYSPIFLFNEYTQCYDNKDNSALFFPKQIVESSDKFVRYRVKDSLIELAFAREKFKD